MSVCTAGCDKERSLHQIHPAPGGFHPFIHSLYIFVARGILSQTLRARSLSPRANFRWGKPYHSSQSIWTSLPGSYSGEATSDHDAIGGAVIAQSAETEVYIELFIIPGTSKQSAELVGTVPRDRYRARAVATQQSKAKDPQDIQGSGRTVLPVQGYYISHYHSIIYIQY